MLASKRLITAGGIPKFYDDMENFVIGVNNPPPDPYYGYYTGTVSAISADDTLGNRGIYFSSTGGGTLNVGANGLTCHRSLKFKYSRSSVVQIFIYLRGNKLWLGLNQDGNARFYNQAWGVVASSVGLTNANQIYEIIIKDTGSFIYMYIDNVLKISYNYSTLGTAYNCTDPLHTTNFYINSQNLGRIHELEIYNTSDYSFGK